MVKKLLFILILLSSISNADIFDKGKTSFGVTAGSSSSYNNSYFLVGVSANYFVLDNLNIGVMYRSWLGSDPMQNELSLSTNYFIKLNEMFRPYMGAFVRERFISGYDNLTSYGARGGLAFISDNSYISVGYAYESFNTCSLEGECSTSYPEIVFGLSF